MTVFRRIALIIPALLIALPAAAFNLASNPTIDLASAPACPAPTFVGANATVTCVFTGGQQTWTTPVGITSATFGAYGAQGGGAFGQNVGGGGGSAVATIAVTPADIYTIAVGGAGSSGQPGSGAGGYNGGANNGGSNNAGGGGGGSDVRFPGSALASRIVVGGGGGGAGQGVCCTVAPGGAGGGLTGNGGGGSDFGETGGGGGSQSGGGGGGSNGDGCCGNPGAAGSLGAGGTGGFAAFGSGGGGGGGGYYGGGGGGDNSSGGGGSGFGPAGTAFTTGTNGGNGVVVITYTRITTSVTLTSSVNPSVFGQSITFTATVSGAGGTPTGTVTFLDGGSSIGTGAMVGGVATLTTSSIAVGGHTITAAYGGDVSFNTSSGALTGTPQVVSKANTSTAVTSSVNPSMFGQSVTFTVTVTAAAPGSGTPTGTVTFLDGGSPFVTRTLASGSATLATSALVVGNHTITTSYAGDGSFNGSAGALTGNPQVVNTANTTTAVTSSSNPQSYGLVVTFTATVSAASPGSGTPTGTVTFLDGGSPIATRTLASGSANLATSALAVGNHTITTSYGGDGNFNGSAGSLTGNPQVIDKDGTSLTLTSSQNPSVFGQSVTFTATVSAAGGTPTGMVTFLDGGTPIGSGTLSSGVAAFATSTLATGGHTITATYAGDGNFNGGSGALTGTPQVVNKAATAIDVASSVNPSVYGQPVTFIAIVGATAPGSGTPTGTVTFLDGGTPIGTATLSAGVARFPTSALAPGNHTITASYGGDVNFAGSAGAQGDNPQVVNLADTSSFLSSSENPSVFGEAVTFTATVLVVSPGAGAPTGIVTFMDGGLTIGTGALSGSAATFTTSDLVVGSHTITASYAGDANFNASSGALAGNPQVVNTASTSTSVNSTSPSTVGQAVTFTAAVAVTSPGAGTPTGTFAFTNDGGAVSGCGNVDIAVGTCVITETTAGTHIIVATYSGDDDFAGSTGSKSQSVDGASTATVVTASPTAGLVGGEAVTFTATVSVLAPGTGTPIGSVVFADGSTVLGSGTLVAGGGGDQATLTTTFAAGPHSITATYGGDADFNNSTSLPAEIAVAIGAATVTLSSSPNPAVAGESVTLSATVIPTAPSTQTPDGTVRFYDGAVLLGTVSVHAGSATFTTAFAAGSHSLTAVYSGNGAYAGATSPATGDVEAVTAVSIPTTGANASSIVQVGVLLMLAGLAWSGAAIRRRRTSRRMQ